MFVSYNLLQTRFGKDNIPDALSRPFEPPLINLLTPVNKPLDFLELAITQRSDSECEELRHDNPSALFLKDISLAEHVINVLCDISTRKILPVILRALCFSVFKHLHCLSHPGIRGSVALLTRNVIWEGIKKDVAQWAGECLKCSRSKIQRHNKAPLNEINPPPSERFTHVYIDITKPLPPSNGYSYLLMIIDRYSRFIQAVPLRGITAKECSSAFVHGWFFYLAALYTYTVIKGLNLQAPYEEIWLNFLVHNYITAQLTTHKHRAW